MTFFEVPKSQILKTYEPLMHVFFSGYCKMPKITPLTLTAWPNGRKKQLPKIKTPNKGPGERPSPRSVPRPTPLIINGSPVPQNYGRRIFTVRSKRQTPSHPKMPSPPKRRTPVFERILRTVGIRPMTAKQVKQARRANQQARLYAALTAARKK